MQAQHPDISRVVEAALQSEHSAQETRNQKVGLTCTIKLYLRTREVSASDAR